MKLYIVELTVSWVARCNGNGANNAVGKRKRGFTLLQSDTLNVLHDINIVLRQHLYKFLVFQGIRTDRNSVRHVDRGCLQWVVLGNDFIEKLTAEKGCVDPLVS